MDLIYTDTKRVDLGILQAHDLDLSFGTDENENDFELSLGKSEPMLEDGAFIYIEGTEYGGIVDGMRSTSTDEVRTHIGRTWHGVINDKIICPDPGADYLNVSGDANRVIEYLVQRLGLGVPFKARAASSVINISSYRFPRYVRAYDGLRDMLASVGGKLKMEWIGGALELYAEPVVDYTDRPVDGDEAALTVERYGSKVNHLICLGAGLLAERQVLHLFVDQFGRIGSTQHFFGLEEIAEIFDYSSAESADDLREYGIKQLSEMRNNDKVELTAYEGSGLEYDIGDIIGGTDTLTGNAASAVVTQKIVNIQNGAVRINYKTGKHQTVESSEESSPAHVDIPVASYDTRGTVRVGDGLVVSSDGCVSVHTTSELEADSLLPMSSAGVSSVVSDINARLENIAAGGGGSGSGVGVPMAGYVYFDVTDDGHLQCTYTGEERPNYSINSEGHLVLEI